MHKALDVAAAQLQRERLLPYGMYLRFFLFSELTIHLIPENGAQYAAGGLNFGK